MPPPLHPSTIRAVCSSGHLPATHHISHIPWLLLAVPPTAQFFRAQGQLALQSWCAQRCPVMNGHLQVRLWLLVPYVLPSEGAGSQQSRSEIEGGILGESGCATDSLCNPDKGSCPL